MCKDRPCWGTPEDIKKIIDAGFRDRLMFDYWSGDPDIYMLAPALVGYEGKNAPWWPNGKCTFLDQNDRCELHDLNLKPLEGRVACCPDKRVGGESHRKLHYDVAMTWNNQTLINIED
jgi:hypothetical protein